MNLCRVSIRKFPLENNVQVKLSVTIDVELSMKSKIEKFEVISMFLSSCKFCKHLPKLVNNAEM